MVHTTVIHPCMEILLSYMGNSTYPTLLDTVESKAFCLIRSPPVTSSLQGCNFATSLCWLAAKLHPFLFSIITISVTALMNTHSAFPFLAEGMHSPVNLLSSFLCSHTRISYVQEAFFHSTAKPWNSLVFPCAYNLRDFQCILSKHFNQETFWSWFWKFTPLFSQETVYRHCCLMFPFFTVY